MRLYLAGPMRGIPNFNFPAFHATAAALRAVGHEVFSPAERDIARHDGVDVSAANHAGDEAQATRDHGFSLRDALAEDLEFICRHAEGVAMMPGWENSAGARAEHATAVALRLSIFYLGERP